jgi:predicted nuclease with TOPRIM domain
VEVEILTPLARDAIVLYLSGPAVDAVAGPVLRRVIDVSARLDEMQAERTALEERRRQTQQMMQEIRADLAVLGTTPRSVEIRERLTRDLDRLTTEFQDLTARIVEIGSRASEMRVELAEAVRDLDLTVEAEGGSSGAPR